MVEAWPSTIVGTGSQKWLNSDYIMKIDSAGFDESDMECDRKRSFQDATQISVLIN